MMAKLYILYTKTNLNFLIKKLKLRELSKVNVETM